jgi:hypothetical protein
MVKMPANGIRIDTGASGVVAGGVGVRVTVRMFR